VLSEMADAWADATARWREMNRAHRNDVGGLEAPSAAEEYLFYQTLVGAWPPREDGPGLVPPGDPSFGERIKQYTRKALLEAKVHTSWINHDEPYEQAVDAFVSAVLDPERSKDFIADVTRFLAPVARAGYHNSLAQVLLKIAAPGVPDFYQGSELWDFSLVDPDNRRPVDYGRRRALLRTLQGGEPGAPGASARDLPALAERLLAAPEDGRVKMLVVSRALTFRRSEPAPFQHGSYEPLQTAGTHAERAVAFARVHHDRAVIAVVGRHFTKLSGPPVGAAWGDTRLQLPEALVGRRWRNVLTEATLAAGRAHPLREIFAHLPVALLEAAR
jgi:(1->4)-alpha-D-glucan 1-alpha-D-glucosylmutase